MTPDRRKFVTLSSLTLCAMLPCAFFSLRHGTHHSAFTFLFFLLLLLNSGLYYLYSSKHRTPDTLVQLFPEPAESSKERS